MVSELIEAFEERFRRAYLLGEVPREYVPKMSVHHLVATARDIETELLAELGLGWDVRVTFLPPEALHRRCHARVSR